MLVVSTALAPALLAVSTHFSRVLILALQILIFLLAVYADPHWTFSQLSFLIALVIQAHMALPLRSATLLTALPAVGLLLQPQRAATAIERIASGIPGAPDIRMGR